MTQTVREFFEGLPGRLDEAKTRGTRASYRFDVDDVGSWHVAVDDGKVSVAESGGDADCAIRMSEETFLKMLRGEQSPTRAFMTGKLKIDGDMALALKLQKLFF